MHVPLFPSETAPARVGQALPAQPRGPRFAFAERLAFLIAVDGLVILVAALCAWLLIPSFLAYPSSPNLRWYWLLLTTSGWWLCAWLNDLYDIPTLRDRASLAFRLTLTSVMGAAACLVAAYTLPALPPVEYLLLFMVITAPIMVLWRWFYLATLGISALSHRTLIVGQGRRAQLAAELVKQESLLNYELVGYVDIHGGARTPAQDGLPVWYDLESLPQVVRRFSVHELVLATEHAPSEALALALIQCQAHGARVLRLPELYERHLRNVPIDQIDPEWALDAARAAPALLQRMTKRLLDLLALLLALPILLILTPLILLAIKLDSPGPVLYRQIRLGRAGEPFTILKFRSMVVNAERDGRAAWAAKDDPRVTRVGRILRKTRLDELPQLLNIWRGEMSLVGPRPERPEFVGQLEQQIPYYRARLLVKPGITGWAQVQYTYTNSVEDSFVKLQYDLYYIHRWSVWLDLYILFRTVAVVLQFKGT